LSADEQGYVTIKVSPRRTSWVKLEILSVKRGSHYPDVAVSEVKAFGR
jgi:hypothetical protein